MAVVLGALALIQQRGAGPVDIPGEVADDVGIDALGLAQAVQEGADDLGKGFGLDRTAGEAEELVVVGCDHVRGQPEHPLVDSLRHIRSISRTGGKWARRDKYG